MAASSASPLSALAECSNLASSIAWRGYSAAAAAATAAAPAAAAVPKPGRQATTDELPLWHFLRQQGFGADCIRQLQAAVRSGKHKIMTSGKRFTAQKLQQGLAPNIAALRAEGLDTATIERLFQAYPSLLNTIHTTFSSSLAALRQLAPLLPDDPRTVQAPPGATPLGVALWRYPTAAACFLTRTNLASLNDGNLRLRRQLGISDAATASALFSNLTVMVSSFERAEAMVAHLQRLQASGELSAQQGEQG